MTLSTSLRVFVGLAAIGVGGWLFARELPRLSFQMLAIFVSFGIFLIEAPRFSKALRVRAQRTESYVKENQVAQGVVNRASQLTAWSWASYGASLISVVAGVATLGPQFYVFTIGAAVLFFTGGLGLGLYVVYLRAAAGIAAASASKATKLQGPLWVATVALLALLVLASFADRVWRVDSVNWLFGAWVALMIVVWVWRWLRGWPDDTDRA